MNFSLNHFGVGLKKRSIRALWLTVLFLMVSPSLFSQVRLNVQNQPIRSVLKSIEKESGYHFFYNNDLSFLDKVTSLKVNSASITATLDKLFENTDLTYKVGDDKLIVISLKEKIAPKTSQGSQSTNRIKGVVVNEKGEPIIGANVLVKGTSKGASTDIEGRFSIDDADNSILVVSFVGFVTKEVEASGKKNLSVVLVEQSRKIDEVVVVAFGTQKKTTLTSSVTQVESKVLQNRPVGNLSTALQGQVAGVVVVQSSGKPGDGASINIRGLGSLNSSTAPLVIVDGIPGSLTYLNPNDVESTSVLKDASAAALYGARAANGVILVTTKKGKAGKATITYSGYAGFQTPTELFKEADAYNYANSYNLAIMYDKIKRTSPNFDPSVKTYTDQQLADWKSGAAPSTNWRKELFSENGFIQSHYVNMTGGISTDNVSLKNSVSFGFFDQEGNVVNTFYKRYNVRYNGEIKSKRFTVTSTLGISYDKKKEPTSLKVGDFGSIISAINRQNPAQPVYTSTGDWNVTGTSDTRNPVRLAHEGGADNMDRYNVLANVCMKYDITKDLNVKFTNGATLTTTFDDIFKNRLTWVDGSEFGPNTSEMSTDKTIYYLQQLDINYQKSFGDHNLTAILAGSQEYTNYKYTYLYRQDFLLNTESSMQLGSANGINNSSTQYDYGMMSLFGRLNYDYKRKYLLEANFRYDGSSRLTPDNNWDFFPSASAGWRISEEPFMEPYKQVLNELKLRASIGTLGNQNLPQKDNTNKSINGAFYPYQAIVGPVGGYIFDGNVQNGLSMIQAPNNILRWERTTSTDVGIVAGFFNNTFTFEGTYFNRVNNNMLMVRPASPILGISDPNANMGKLRNYGFEFSLGYNKTTKQGINIYANGNLSYLHNEIEDLGGLAQTADGATLNAVGYPINAYYVYLNDGLLTKQEFLDPNYKLQNTAQKYGDLKFKDINGDGKIDNNDKVLINKSSTPKWIYGLNFDVSYKGIGIAGMIQGAAGAYKYLGSSIAYGYLNGYSVTQWAIDHAYNPTKDENNYNTLLPRLSINNSVNQTYVTDRWIFDASYVRLKNLQVYYNLPHSLISKAGISNLKVYFSGQNLYTITALPKELGIDPELGSATAGYPLLRVITFGVDLTL
jgi:TonB-linked outer membrane protein, SusC/RagA family